MHRRRSVTAPVSDSIVYRSLNRELSQVGTTAVIAHGVVVDDTVPDPSFKFTNVTCALRRCGSR